MTLKLFVYGTLMPQYTNKLAWLAGGHPMTSTYAELHGYKMYNLGAFPGIVPSTNAFDVVAGQLVTMTGLTQSEYDNIIRNLDRYEGTPSLYRRELRTCQTQHLHDGAVVDDAFVYIFNSSVEGRDHLVTPVHSRPEDIQYAAPLPTDFNLFRW